MKDNNLLDAIIQHLSENKSSEHASELLEHIKQNKEATKTFEDLTNLIDAYRMSNFEKSIDEQAAWERFVNSLPGSETPVVEIQKRSANRKWWWVAAAVFAILVTLGVLTTKMTDVPNTSPTSTITVSYKNCYLKINDSSIFELPDQITYFTQSDGSISDSLGKLLVPAGTLSQNNQLRVPAGSSCTIKLQDGTSIVLNSASSLQFPASFAANERLVTLTGEGYFKVAHNVNQPFIVNTQNTKVRVLGTVFTVKAYPDEKEVTTLISGSVIVSGKKGNTIKLQPGETVIATTEELTKNTTLQSEEPTWVNGFYFFNKTLLSDIAPSLERWYDVKLAFENEELAKRTFTGAVEKAQPIKYFLDLLAESSGNIKYKIEGKNITLYSSNE